MAEIQITLGRATSVRSFAICEKIRSIIEEEPIGSPIFWVVPDEIAYTTERALMDELDTSLRAEVITMRRLAERIFQFGGNRSIKMINTTGKRLLLASVYQHVLPHLDSLKRDRPSMAFFDTILNAFDELSEHLVDIAQLEGAIEVAAASLDEPSERKRWTPSHSLIGKLRDICILYVHYRRAMETEEFLDPAGFLTEVLPMIPKYTPILDGTVFFDGFADMSPQMTEFALSVARHARFAEFTMPVDPTWMDDEGFRIWQRTRHKDLASIAQSPRLVEMMDARKNQSGVFMPHSLLFLINLTEDCDSQEIPYVINKVNHVLNSEGSSDLLHIEQNLFSDAAVKPEVSRRDVTFAKAANIHLEVTGIAREIKRLTLENLALHDRIAVVVPNIEEYRSYVEEVFSKYQIPYNLDVFPSLSDYPLAKFLLAVCEAIREKFSSLSMIRLIKTDFCGLTPEEADWFETYIRAYEVYSKEEWLQNKAWAYATRTGDGRRLVHLQEDDAKAERYRNRIIRYMLPLYQIMSQPVTTPLQVAKAVWSLFKAVNAKETIANWMVNEDGSQNPLEASLHEQAWQYLISLCNDLSNVAPNTKMDTNDIIRILIADIERVSLSSIPSAIDHILVTDFSRAHGWTADVVFVMGLTDKAVPKRFSPTGLLQDEERLAFQRLFGTPLGYTCTDLQLAYRGEIYHLFTRARRKLVLSYPLVSSDGRDARASVMLLRVESLFTKGSLPHLEWQSEEELCSCADGTIEPLILTPDAALDLAVLQVRNALSGQKTPILKPLLEWFTENEKQRQVLFDAMRGFTHHHDKRRLDRSLCKALYGNPLKMNVYQLESFSACPFKHFVQYGLRVNAEDANVVTPATKGTLLHDVLLSFVKEHMSDMENWRNLSDDDAVVSMRQHFERVIAAPKFILWHKEAIRLLQADEVLASLDEAAITLTRHARYGLFAPYAVELSFGLPEDGSLPSFNVPLEDGEVVSLRGRIDRVDLYTDGETSAFRIIDYKSSQLDIDLTKVEHGLRLQLPVYAAVIEHHSKELFGDTAKAVGILYIPVTRKVELKNTPTDESTAHYELLKRMRAKGYFTADKDIVGAMDKRLLDSVDTELFSKVYNKNETLAKHAPALPEDEWQMLIGRGVAHVKDIATRIMSGDVSVSPYKISQTETACSNCPFQALCQFDPIYDGHLYRKLKKFSRSDIPLKWAPYRRGAEE